MPVSREKLVLEFQADPKFEDPSEIQKGLGMRKYSDKLRDAQNIQMGCQREHKKGSWKFVTLVANSWMPIYQAPHGLPEGVREQKGRLGAGNYNCKFMVAQIGALHFQRVQGSRKEEP